MTVGSGTTTTQVGSVVVGARGLLGSAVVRAIRSSEHFTLVDAPRVRWGSPIAATEDLAKIASALAERSGAWTVFWCAGAGVNGMDREAADQEVAQFEAFLSMLAAAPHKGDGVVFLASSAGGVFAGSTGAPFSEASPAVPLGEYGRTKLRLEAALDRLPGHGSIRSVVGRFSNIYGPGQDLDKQQGLISHLCRSSLHRRPMSIFVPLDTLRDYVYVDDAARMALAVVRAHQRSSTRSALHVLASGSATTVATVITSVAAVAGSRPLIVQGVSPLTSMQSHDLRLVPSSVALLASEETPLAVGIGATWRDMFAQFVGARRG